MSSVPSLPTLFRRGMILGCSGVRCIPAMLRIPLNMGPCDCDEPCVRWRWTVKRRLGVVCVREDAVCMAETKGLEMMSSA